MAWTRALVTGASSGIGERIAQRLAAQGCDVVLVARSEQELAANARMLQSRYGVAAEPLAADLTQAPELARVAARLRDDDRPVDLMVNNAGFGTVGPAIDLPLEREEDLIRLNVLAVVQLSTVAAAAMRARGGGTLLNVASLAAYAPIPYFAAYSASKAFVLHFSLALREELRGTGVSVTTVCPGAVDSTFAEKAGVLNPPMRRLWAEPDTVARRALAGASGGRALVLPGPSVPFAAAAARVLPPSLFARTFATVARSVAGGVICAATARNEWVGHEPPAVDDLHEHGSDEEIHA